MANPVQPGAGQNGSDDDAPFMERREESSENSYKRSIYSIPVDVHVTIGTARPTIAELLKMRRDSLIQLNAKIDDPVELYVDDRVIARGELTEIEGSDGQLGVRLTEIVDISEDKLK